MDAATSGMTECQRAKAELLAKRFGCWPHDIAIVLTGQMADVTFGVSKGRPKHILIDTEGGVHRA